MTNEQIISGNKLIAKFMGGITAEENHKIVYQYRDIWLPIHSLCTWTTIKTEWVKYYTIMTHGTG